MRGTKIILIAFLLSDCGGSSLVGEQDAETSDCDGCDEQGTDEESLSEFPYSTSYPFSSIRIGATSPEIFYQESSITAMFGHRILHKNEIMYDYGNCIVNYYPQCEPECDYRIGEFCTENNECSTRSDRWYVGPVKIRGASGMELIRPLWGEYGTFYFYDHDSIIFSYNDLLEIEVEGNQFLNYFKETIRYPELLTGVEAPSSIQEDPYIVRWDPSDGDLMVYNISSAIELSLIHI